MWLKKLYVGIRFCAKSFSFLLLLIYTKQVCVYCLKKFLQFFFLNNSKIYHQKIKKKKKTMVFRIYIFKKTNL